MLIEIIRQENKNSNLHEVLIKRNARRVERAKVIVKFTVRNDFLTHSPTESVRARTKEIL